ncbi:MAG: AbrB/MazE/SpoVT family DNA-binding domain-containing protein [Betaproteobacteria bacterium]|nr:AbrB/MazE/SpoVT family DNA-binding domain-containing protein [Betaproteobacteria bacterium]
MKTAKLFMNGKSQAVRLPKEFRFDGTEVVIERAGDGVLLLPAAKDRWANLRVSLKMFRGKLSRRQPKAADKRDWPW